MTFSVNGCARRRIRRNYRVEIRNNACHYCLSTEEAGHADDPSQALCKGVAVPYNTALHLNVHGPSQRLVPSRVTAQPQVCALDIGFCLL